MSVLLVAALTLHLLAAVVWVGGMFFAFLAARPVLAELDTALRARLWVGIFRRFFPWVWACIVTLLVTGFYMASADFESPANTPAYVRAMMGLGIFMMLLFGHVYFAAFPKLKRGAAGNDEALMKKAMGQIRLIFGVNLALGLLVLVIATVGMYATTD